MIYVHLVLFQKLEQNPMMNDNIFRDHGKQRLQHIV